MCAFKRLAGLTTTLIALVFVQTVFAQTGFAEDSDRPNVIIMVADDLGWNDVGYHGGNIDTPSLDKLAEQGVQLNRF
ncbi:MAG: arylsulfatase, partial [Proteobacteria bacterium]